MLFYKEFNPEGTKTILLLHGLGAHSDSWAFQFEVFANAGYRVIAPDFTGFGRSAYARGPISVKTMADDIYNFLKQINVQRAHFVGLSMGGAVAMQFALDHPVIVEKMVLANTSAKFMVKGKLTYFMMRFFISKLLGPKIRAKLIARYVFPKSEHNEYRLEFIKEMQAANPRAYMRLVRSFLRYDLSRRVQQLKMPILVIGGREDRTLPPFMQAYLHEKIRGSKYLLLDGGHVSSIENHIEFNQAVLDFLGNN